MAFVIGPVNNDFRIFVNDVFNAYTFKISEIKKKKTSF